jgi:hypothetical protein
LWRIDDSALGEAEIATAMEDLPLADGIAIAADMEEANKELKLLVIVDAFFYI